MNQIEVYSRNSIFMGAKSSAKRRRSQAKLSRKIQMKNAIDFERSAQSTIRTYVLRTPYMKLPLKMLSL